LSSDAFKQLTLPRRLSSPLFSRYEEGMEYGPHTDDAYHAQERLRTDIALTMFLSDPDSYEGGALVVGDSALKPAAGDVAVYPATSIHRVAQVSRGTRLAAGILGPEPGAGRRTPRRSIHPSPHHRSGRESWRVAGAFARSTELASHVD
jgi:hypothetical protein